MAAPLTADAVLDVLGDGCLTTTTIARALRRPVDEVADACRRFAREERLRLVSQGWDFSLAWAGPDADLVPPHRSDPWYMTAREVMAELRGGS